MSDKDMNTITHQVIIPVKRSGYTGQRDAYQEHVQDTTVLYDQKTGQVTLTSRSPRQEAVTFSFAALQGAVRALGQADNPVYRDTPTQKGYRG